MRSALASFVLLAACTQSKDGLTTYNTAPTVSITLPADRSSFDEGDSVEFFAQVDDAQDASEDLLLTWTSDLDGPLAPDLHADSSGTVTFSTANLSPGNHTITLAATDSGAETGEDSITIGIVDLEDAPEIAWIHPISGEYGEEGIDFEFKVEAHDLQDAPADLDVVLTSTIDGEFCVVEIDGAGIGECPTALSVGEHTLTATVTDTDENTQSEQVYFEVVAGTTTDDDEDGWTERQGDCDDADADVHPNAPETDNDVDDD